MPQKPEAKFIAKVHRLLDKRVYHQGMGLTASNGTWDEYYEGDKDILWVEYKYMDKFPEVLDLCNRKSYPKLSKLQQRWGLRAHRNNVPIAVCVGSKNMALFIPGDLWTKPICATNTRAYDIMDIPQLIEEMTLATPKTYI